MEKGTKQIEEIGMLFVYHNALFALNTHFWEDMAKWTVTLNRTGTRYNTVLVTYVLRKRTTAVHRP